MPLQFFRDEQRVRITSPMAPPALKGTTGTVKRLRRCDYGAYVEMDTDLPDFVRAFPIGDQWGRERHVLLYPSDCDAEPDKIGLLDHA